jgi:hypothetical protein
MYTKTPVMARKRALQYFCAGCTRPMSTLTAL